MPLLESCFLWVLFPVETPEKRPYSAVFIILILIGYFVYQGIVRLQEWIISWSPIMKVVVPVSMLIMIAGTLLMFYSRQMDAD